jgi:hypothetical protein
VRDPAFFTTKKRISAPRKEEPFAGATWANHVEGAALKKFGR